MEFLARVRSLSCTQGSDSRFRNSLRLNVNPYFPRRGVHREFVARGKKSLDSFHRTWTGCHSQNEDGVAMQVRILDNQIIPNGNNTAARLPCSSFYETHGLLGQSGTALQTMGGGLFQETSTGGALLEVSGG